MTPASVKNPRFVTHDEIVAFERGNPFLAGIGEIMLRRGIWILDEESDGEVRK